MKELAEHILYVAHKNKKSITNLQLQKILYFSLRYSVPEIGLRAAIQTYNEPFITTKYGPLVKSQYQRFYGYGSSPIIGNATQREEYNALNKMILELLDKDVFVLVKSSQLNDFWKRHEEEIVKEGLVIQYPIEAVLKLDNNNQERLVDYIFAEKKIN
jgi:uncharacterized phage-associated protein